MLTLALGGGGARGLAHLGVLQVLEKHGIPVHAIAGTSMGGLIGALYAAGLSCSEIETQLLENIRKRELLRLIDPHLSRHGLRVRGRRVLERMEELLGSGLDFADLPRRLALVTTDLHTGQRVVLDRGPVAEAVRATISIPLVFEPVERGPLLLADGGLVENLPIRAARELHAGPVVAVDVLPHFAANQPGEAVVTPPLHVEHVPARLNDAMHAILVMMQQSTELLLAAHEPELLLRPELPPTVTILSGWSQAEAVIAAGRSSAEAALPLLDFEG